MEGFRFQGRLMRGRDQRVQGPWAPLRWLCAYLEAFKAETPHRLVFLGMPKLPRACKYSHGRVQNKLEHGSGMIWAGFPSSLGFGVGGQSYSRFLASTVVQEHTSNIILGLQVPKNRSYLYT